MSKLNTARTRARALSQTAGWTMAACTADVKAYADAVYDDVAGELAVVAFTCPTKSGTCTPGTTACDEDLGCPHPIHACVYTCQANGTWGSGTECSYNICEAGKCGAQGSQ